MIRLLINGKEAVTLNPPTAGCSAVFVVGAMVLEKTMILGF